jgi:hypothetical protein
LTRTGQEDILSPKFGSDVYPILVHFDRNSTEKFAMKRLCWLSINCIAGAAAGKAAAAQCAPRRR